MNDARIRMLIIAIALIYVISPIDALPGPFDDIVIMLLGAIANSRIKVKNR